MQVDDIAGNEVSPAKQVRGDSGKEPKTLHFLSHWLHSHAFKCWSPEAQTHVESFHISHLSKPNSLRKFVSMNTN